MTARERRFVLGGVVAVALTILGALLPRLLATSAAESPAALQAERAARVRGLAASVDTLAAVAQAAARQERASSAAYLGGGTPQVAASQLSDMVARAAEASQVEILREGVLPARSAGMATAIPLELIARGDLPGLLQLLRAIEEAPLLLTVEELRVGADPRERPGVPSLTLTLRVVGFALGSQPKVES